MPFDCPSSCSLLFYYFLQVLNLMESWDCLTDKLTRLMKDNIPESKTSLDPTKRRPYVNPTCLESIKVKHMKWTRYRHTMTDANNKAYKSAINRVKTELRKAKYSFEKDLGNKIKRIINSFGVMFVQR